jgi:hypothetical protein
MLLLTLQISWLEIVILQIGALILGCTIYFFCISRRYLQQAMKGNGDMWQRPARKSLLEQFALKREVMPAQQHKRPQAAIRPEAAIRGTAQKAPKTDVKATTNSQQATQEYTTIYALMQRVEQLEAHAGTRQINVDMHQRIEELEAALAEKVTTLNQVRQQEAIARQMSGRMEEVFREFELLQQKYSGLEAQATAAQEQALELQELQQAYNLMQKDLVRKQEKLEDLAEENERLQLELMAATDKLLMADQQRQHLTHRSRAVHDMQIDIAAISEGQSKLQQQLRHISELESMLEQFGTLQEK